MAGIATMHVTQHNIITCENTASDKNIAIMKRIINYFLSSVYV